MTPRELVVEYACPRFPDAYPLSLCPGIPFRFVPQTARSRAQFAPSSRHTEWWAVLPTTQGVMKTFGTSMVEWWLPASYVGLVAILEILWKARTDSSPTSNNKDNDDSEGINASVSTSLHAPLLQGLGGERNSSRLVQCLRVSRMLTFLTVARIYCDDTFH